MDSISAQWSQLPKELLETITKHIDSCTDLPFVRAVCKPWRSSLPPSPHNSQRLPIINLPFPIGPNSNLNPKRRGHFALIERRIYHLEPRDVNPNRSSSSSKGWLVKLEQEKSKMLRLMDPLSKIVKVERLPDGFPKVLINLFNFKVSAISKAYGLQYVGRPNEPPTEFNELKSTYITKVVTSSSGSGEYAIMAIHAAGKLGYIKLGDKEWSIINDGHSRSHYDDIAYHKGKFYALDFRGRLLVIDSPLKFSEIANPLRGTLHGDRYLKLVESCGDLFLVGRSERGGIKFIVYKLVNDKNCWVEVKNLGGRAFFLGDDCTFSLSAKDLSGCKENCIYFNKMDILEDDGDYPGYSAGIFDLKDSKTRRLSSVAGYSQIFWPPPTWLTADEHKPNKLKPNKPSKRDD